MEPLRIAVPPSLPLNIPTSTSPGKTVMAVRCRLSLNNVMRAQVLSLSHTEDSEQSSDQLRRTRGLGDSLLPLMRCVK